MPSTVRYSRRRLLATGAALAAGLAGCTTGPGEGSPPGTGSDTTSPGTGRSGTPTTTATPGEVDALSVRRVRVADFIEYPLSGTHPHVHNRRGTSYVVVETETELDHGTVAARLDVILNGTAMPVAERQPVPWQSETVDVAYAVPKGRTYTAGSLRVDATTVRRLGETALTRLSNPPVFEVAAPSISPEQLRVDSRTTATVRFSLENSGGAGTFGASLKGSLSGANTVTAAMDAGGEREVVGTTTVIGNGDEVRVRLDWGYGDWTTTIPVVEETTTA